MSNLEKLKNSGAEYTSAGGKKMKAWSTYKGGVVLEIDTGEISVLLGDDNYFGSDDLDFALKCLLDEEK